MSVAGYLATGGEILARDVLEFAGDDGRPFSEYLQHALGLILNGSETSRDPLERRAPRLGYALAFAQAVQSHLLNALQRARAYQSSAPADDGGRSWWKQLWVRLGGGKASQKDWQAAADMIQSWAAITGRALESIQPVRNLLIGVEAHGDQPAIRGLYDELVLRQARAEQRRKQMDQVAVRRYLWSRPADPDKDPADPQNQQDLADEWYQQAEQQLPSYLNRFYWSIEPDGHVQLAVITFTEAQKAIALDGSKPASVQRLADEIMGMAFHVTQDWARNTTLRNVLATQLSSKYIDPARILVERVWPIATPHLLHAPDVNGALDGKHIATAGLPDAVQKDAYLAAISQVLAELGTTRSRVNTFLDPCSTNIVTATDRTAMTLVREHNLMPMANLPEFQDAWQTYSRNAGRQTDALVESARLAAVFAAERQALEYERRLESTQVVNQDFRLLHPLIVLALARPDLTELYALAFAAGWVETRTGTPWLRLPVQGGEYELALRGRAAATGGFDPRVSGLLRMTSGSSDDEGMISKLRVALSNPDEATKAAWRSFIGRYRYTQMEAVKYVCELGHEMKPGAKFCGKCGRGPAASVVQQPPRGPWRPPFEGEQQDVQDLGAMAALAAYRRLAPDDWDDLIMPRPRLAS